MKKSNIKLELIKIEHEFFIASFDSNKKSLKKLLDVVQEYSLNLTNLNKFRDYFFLKEKNDILEITFEANEKEDLRKVILQLFEKPVLNIDKVINAVATGLSINYVISEEEAKALISVKIDGSIKIDTNRALEERKNQKLYIIDEAHNILNKSPECILKETKNREILNNIKEHQRLRFERLKGFEKKSGRIK